MCYLEMHAYGIGAPMRGSIFRLFFIQTPCLKNGHAFIDVSMLDEQTH